MLDATQTPTISPAGLGRRFAAKCVDTAVLTVLGSTVFAVGAGTGDLTGLAVGVLVGLVLLPLAYPFVLLSRSGRRNGQTLGKQLLGIRVVTLDGTPVSPARALWRDGFAPMLLGLALFVPAVLDVLWPLVDPQRRALHDKLARTLVVDASQNPVVARQAIGRPGPRGPEQSRRGTAAAVMATLAVLVAVAGASKALSGSPADQVVTVPAPIEAAAPEVPDAASTTVVDSAQVEPTAPVESVAAADEAQPVLSLRRLGGYDVALPEAWDVVTDDEPQVAPAPVTRHRTEVVDPVSDTSVLIDALVGYEVGPEANRDDLVALSAQRKPGYVTVGLDDYDLDGRRVYEWRYRFTGEDELPVRRVTVLLRDGRHDFAVQAEGPQPYDDLAQLASDVARTIVVTDR